MMRFLSDVTRERVNWKGNFPLKFATLRPRRFGYIMIKLQKRGSNKTLINEKLIHKTAELHSQKECGYYISRQITKDGKGKRKLYSTGFLYRFHKSILSALIISLYLFLSPKTCTS